MPTFKITIPSVWLFRYICTDPIINSDCVHEFFPSTVFIRRQVHALFVCLFHAEFYRIGVELT